MSSTSTCPFHAEDYVHRIGRTGRAGRQGAAFTLASADDARNVAAIEKLTGMPIPRIEVEGLDAVSNEEIAEAAARPSRGRGRGAPAPRRAVAPRGRGRATAAPNVAHPSAAHPNGAEAAAQPERAERRPRGDRAERAGRDRGGRERDATPVAAREERPRQDDRAPPRERPPLGPRQRGSAPPALTGDRDDLGPSVVGFGDAVPAFMLIPIPRPRREAVAEQDHEAEAA